MFIKFLISVPLALSLPKLQERQQSFQSPEQKQPAEEGAAQKRLALCFQLLLQLGSAGMCCSGKPRDKTRQTRRGRNLLTSRTHGIIGFSSRKSGFCSLSQPRRVLLRLFQRLKIQIHDNLRIQVTQRMPLTRLLTSGGNEPSPVVALCRLIGFNDRLRVYTDQQIGWGLFLASSGVRPEENHIHWW